MSTTIYNLYKIGDVAWYEIGIKGFMTVKSTKKVLNNNNK